MLVWLAVSNKSNDALPLIMSLKRPLIQFYFMEVNKLN